MYCTKEVVMIAYFNFNYNVKGEKEKEAVEETEERGLSLSIL